MKIVVCVSILVVSVVASSGCGAIKQSYIAKGNALFSAGKYEEASLNYRKAIQKEPNFGEAYYRLGLTAIKLGQWSLAYNALDHAIRLPPANVDAQEKFGDICLRFYLADPAHPQLLYTQITRLSDDFLSKNGNSYKGLLLRGYLASSDRKFSEAIEYFRKALRVNPSNPELVAELAQVLIQDGQAKAGEELALGWIASQKTSFGPIYDLLYGFYLHANRESEAENILNAKVKNNPKEADYLVQLAGHYNHTQKPAEMQATLRRLLDDPTNFPKARLQVGDFYLGLRDYSLAIRYYQEGLNGNPEAKLKVAYQKRSVVALLSQGNKVDAARLAGQVVKENPTDNEALHLHAGILLDSGKRENADVAVREFQILTSQNPSDASLLFQLGQAYRLKGDLNGARVQFVESLTKQNDLVASRYELAEISLLQQRPADAVQQANRILGFRPNDRKARLFRTAGLIAQGAAAEARGELAQLILGLLAIAESRYPEAIDVLGNYRIRGDPRVCTGLAVAYLHLKQYDKAREVLNEGLRLVPDSHMLLGQLADTEALAGHYDLAIDQLQKLLSSDPESVNLRQRMAEVYELKGDHSNEIAYYREASELAPNDLGAALSLADALARDGRTGEARSQFEKVVKTHTENAPALNNAAFFLADSGGDLDEALRLAQHALEKIPGQPGFWDTVGYIYLKKGLNESAVQTFTNLARKYPHAIFHYHLGLALYMKGDKPAARKELQSALAGNPSAEDKARIQELLHKIS
jgi:tetratricopeptide (TPR) repeat protein